jgi:hypothetical protein
MSSDQLVRELLQFTTVYKAIGGLTALNNRVMLEKEDDPIMEMPYPWLRGAHVHDGILAAINDAKQFKNRVCFAGQLNYTADDPKAFLRLNANALPVRSNPLTIKHKYMVWYVNLTPTDGQLGVLGGNHWCVLLLDFPDRRNTEKSISIGTMLDFGYIDVRVRFFDPMGGKISPAIEATTRALLTQNLVGALGQAKAFDEKQVEKTAIVFEDLEWKYQTDTRQCGVWCVWMVQQLMLHGDLTSHETWETPPDQENPQNKKYFRELYFRKYEESPVVD